MTAKEALTKLTVMLGLNTPEVSETAPIETVEASSETVVEETATEQAFAEAELIDGTIVVTEGELVVGATLFVVTPEGNVNAPEGMHETTTNQIISVDENGVITSIEEKATEETPEPAEASAATEADFSEDLVKSISDIITPALNEIASLKEEIATLQQNFSEFKDEPAGKKITNNLSEYKQAEQQFQSDRYAALKRIKGVK